ncbi:LysR substrate-binding domain-containing protein [Streptomyces sp. DT203]|uniref:LysR substrate-binding domain-containing protein n=1 Tax=Streptomyces sp. DT203 TaxID=3393424 RepID=UPI003CF93FAD
MQGVWAGLHRALAELRAEHPGVSVRLQQAPVANVRQALSEGTVDLAVVALEQPGEESPRPSDCVAFCAPQWDGPGGQRSAGHSLDLWYRRRSMKTGARARMHGSGTSPLRARTAMSMQPLSTHRRCQWPQVASRG